ncbi:TraB/GumN family protein [Alkalicaulis satelles]|uniref:TraB/GumN family protein n=1 Tax=Alkalicaulis satelles TaxID=2609175 RepID=A0A5M6ZJM2_9PROT|nr:TraB/GumN family protein [Alkalicaulis satelles]KAA5802431.1 TraB/GumN family protein [Alkalicaulis satelles]
MKLTIKRFAAALTAGLAWLGAFAAPALAETDFAAVEADPALWRIAAPGGDVYLFGTVHILPPQLEWRTDAVEAALASSERIYFEVDALSEQAQAETMALIPQLGLNAPGVTLTSMISQEAQANLAQMAERLGAPPSALASTLDPLQPWLAGLTLAVMQIQAAGYDPEAGVEHRLKDFGQQAGLSFGYFETIEQQLRFFADLPLEAQITDFEIGLAQALDDPDMLDRMVLAWAAGDTDTLDAIMNDAMREASSNLYDVLIVQRNHDWIPLIENIIERGEQAFIAVGAGHVTGPEGVVGLLQARGHEVVRVNP